MDINKSVLQIADAFLKVDCKGIPTELGLEKFSFRSLLGRIGRLYVRYSDVKYFPMPGRIYPCCTFEMKYFIVSGQSKGPFVELGLGKFHVRTGFPSLTLPRKYRKVYTISFWP